MKAYSSNEIKQELVTLPPKKLVELCLRLVRFKKENKELLSYLLFEAHNDSGYVETIKKEIDENFEALPKANWYHTKKGLRKILRFITKYSKYVASKEAEVEMRLHFCNKMNENLEGYKRITALTNMYKMQVKKIQSLIPLVHEDLQRDFTRQLQEIEV